MRKESHIIKLEKSSRRGNFQIFIYWHSLKTFSLCLWTHRLTKFLVTFTHSGHSFRDNDFYWFSEYWFYCARGRIKIENFLFIFFQVIVFAQFLFLVDTTRHIVSEQSPSIGKHLNAKEKPIYAKDQCESLIALSSIRKVLNSSS